LPDVPGLGVWQIDTGSKNSILNVNSCARMIKQAFGRISLIPLKLTFEPIQVNNPENGKKQTVYVLNLRTDITIAQLADAARENAKMLQVGATLEDAFDIAVEKDVDELWQGDKAVVIKDEVIELAPEPELINDIEWPEGEAIPPHAPRTAEELLGWVAEAKGYTNTLTARSYLINEGNYTPERIAKDPAGIYTELVERV